MDNLIIEVKELLSRPAVFWDVTDEGKVFRRVLLPLLTHRAIIREPIAAEIKGAPLVLLSLYILTLRDFWVLLTLVHFSAIFNPVLMQQKQCISALR
jgi:hypothetical protein